MVYLFGFARTWDLRLHLSTFWQYGMPMMQMPCQNITRLQCFWSSWRCGQLQRFITGGFRPSLQFGNWRKDGIALWDDRGSVMNWEGSAKNWKMPDTVPVLPVFAASNVERFLGQRGQQLLLCRSSTWLMAYAFATGIHTISSYQLVGVVPNLPGEGC